MYKHHSWSKKHPSAMLKNIFSELSQYMHLYKRRTDMLFYSSLKPDDVHVLNSIKYFEINHPNLPSLKNAKRFFHLIEQYDKVISIDQHIILYHSYILMTHLSNYLHLFSFYNAGAFKETTFAFFRSDKQRYLSKFNEHSRRSQEVDAIAIGPNLLQKFIYQNLYNNYDVTDAFINQCTLIPIHQYRDLDDSTLEVNILKKVIDFFGSTDFNSNKPIYKSLAIILVSYLTHRMKVPNKEAVFAVDALFDDVYYPIVGERYEIDGSANKLLSNVYITGRLDGLPIFASSGKESYILAVHNELERFYIQAQEEINIDLTVFDYKIHNPLKNIISPYLSLAPMEFLQPYT